MRSSPILERSFHCHSQDAPAVELRGGDGSQPATKKKGPAVKRKPAKKTPS